MIGDTQRRNMYNNVRKSIKSKEKVTNVVFEWI